MIRWLQLMEALRALARAFPYSAKADCCAAAAQYEMPSSPSHPRSTRPLVAAMRRLGTVWTTVLAAIGAAALSTFIAWLLCFLIDVPNYQVHILLALLIPFIVTPPFGYLMALTIGDLRQARARSRQLVEEAAREREHLELAVNNMPIGLVMFDSGKRLIVGNDRYRELYGLPQDAMARGTHLHTMLEYRLKSGNFEGEREAYSDRILKLVEQKETSARVVKLGDARCINIIHQPLAGGGWIGTHEDVTERERLNAQLASQNDLLKDREERLQTQNALLDAALANMSQGLCMFDKNNCLVLCNAQYRKMYSLSEQQTKPGTPLKELLQHRAASGSYPKELQPDAYIAGLMMALSENRTWSKMTELPDGRFVCVVNSTMPGGGWVATHEDVTELKKREQELRAQNHRFDAAVSNMPQALCMFDADRRLVICNDRYAELYSLPPELTRPGTCLNDILAARAANGLYDGTHDHAEALRRIVDENVLTTKVTELANGRTIFIKHRPMVGGGWVSTHEDITEQRRIEARIEHMAHHDALTDLPNRFLLRCKLDDAVKQATHENPVAVLLLDFDRFKEVNDTLGHEAGDTLLKAAAERLRTCVRSDDTIARLGGDEFAIVQTEAAQPFAATALAQRIIATIGAPHDLNGHKVVIGTSIGIAVCPGDAAEPDGLLKKADLALYRAKADGRNTYRFFETRMGERMHARRMLELDLRSALAEGAFKLHYQPIMNLQRNEVTTLEALIRWHHPERGAIPPAEFIPLAEEVGLIGPIGEWVLRSACAEAAAWPRDIKVAVNLSPLQFKQDDLVQLVFSALASSGLDPSRLELEITETVLIESSEHTLAKLNRLRGLGVSISMDDFGTGYSSLSTLRGLPFQKIKVDKSFIQGLGDDEQCLTIIQAIASLGAGLGMVTTAEGVETREQLDALRALQISEVQGYLISRPAPAAEILRTLPSLAARTSLAA